MPTYVYHCDSCGTEFEATQRFSDDPLRFCPEGHEAVRRVFTPAGIIFKGSGWYIKDSKPAPTKAASSSDGKRTPKSEQNGSGGDSEKSESGTKKETASEPAQAPSEG